jgi:predicted outer membrane repeat protein
MRTTDHPRGRRARSFRLGLVIALVAGGLALASAAPAAAAEIEVTSGADSGPGTLRQALLDADDGSPTASFITFAPGIRVELDSPLQWSGGVNILSIAGPATIDGNGAHQALVVDSDEQEVRLEDLTVVDAGGAGGSAIEVITGSLHATGCTFRGNHSNGDGGAISSTSQAASTEVLVALSTFTDNTSAGDGGAISGVQVSSQRSTFTGNEAGGSGGAIAADSWSSQQDRLRDNVATGDGGAVTADGLFAYRSSFEGNEAGEDGGALHLTLSGDPSDTALTESTLRTNVAAGLGGALSVTSDFDELAFPSFDRNLYVGNRAATGGAVHTAGSVLLLMRSTFTENTATTAGGAVAAEQTAYLWSSTLVGNQAPTGAHVAAPALSAVTTVLARPLGGGLSCSVTTGASLYSRDSGTSCRFAAGGDDTDSVQSAPDPQLGPLRDTGGPTLAMVPSATSPLLDRYTASGLLCAVGDAYLDQRRAPRKVGSGCDIGAVERQRSTFGDVNEGAAFFLDIEWMAGQGISTGTPASPKPLYKPNAPVSRSAMSAFLYRMVGSPLFTPPAEPTFGDVSTTHPFYEEIEWMAAEGVSTGTPGSPKPAFKPSNAVTREAMSAFMFRLFAHPSFSDPAEPTFTDVGPGHTFFTEIEWMASYGISTGYEPGPNYKPGAAVSRQAMSAFLHRLAPPQ